MFLCQSKVNYKITVSNLIQFLFSLKSLKYKTWYLSVCLSIFTKCAGFLRHVPCNSPVYCSFHFEFSETAKKEMQKLWSVLKKPSRLDDFSTEDRRGFLWYLSSTRGQVKLLHAVGVAYTIIFCFLVCWSSIFLGLPLVFEGSPNSLFVSKILMFYIWICIECNYLLIRHRAKDSYVLQQGSDFLPTNEKYRNFHWMSSGRGNTEGKNSEVASDWTKCNHCDIFVPPRTRHCSICRTCVLKKDHHCFFTGCCIGFYNQKYFITFCVYGIVGGSWGIFNLGTYLTTNYSPMLSFQICNYFLPVCFVEMLLSYTSVFEFLLVFLFYLHITSTATSLYYFIWEMYIIARGQTSYECMKNKKLYSTDFWSHMRSVFGPNWLIGFLIPVPFIVNEGDGINWEINPKHS